MSSSSRESIYDLNTSYPLIPDEEVSDANLIKEVLDLRVCFTLDSGQFPWLDHPDLGFAFTVYLIGLDDVSGTFELLAIDYDIDLLVTVPVMADMEGGLNPQVSGYILAPRGGIKSHLSHPVLVNPACVHLFMHPSSLKLLYRGDVRMADGSLDDNGSRVNGQMAPSTEIVSDGKILESGHNLDISFEGNLLSFTGLPGFGLGKFKDPPFVDYDPALLEPVRGLRDINGLSGDISFRGDYSIEIETSADEVCITPMETLS